MAAIYQWYPSGTFIVTTPPYPIENVDNLNWTVAFDVGFDFGVLTESVEPSASITQGTLIDVYLSTGILSESVEPSASIIQGTILQVYLSTGVLSESVEPSASIEQGELKLGVVRHLVQPVEYLDFVPEWTGGSIT